MIYVALADHLAAHQTDLNPQDRSTRDPTEDELIDLFNRYRNQMGYPSASCGDHVFRRYMRRRTVSRITAAEA